MYRSQHNVTNKINKSNKNEYYKFQLNIDKGDNSGTKGKDKGGKGNEKGNEKGDMGYDTENYGRKMWKTVKALTNNCKQTPPRILSHNGSIITSLKEICNIANRYYVTKIR